jgi:hypothetical protein
MDGELRASDNWQHGMPLDCYIKSGFRHFIDWWLEHRGERSRAGLEDALCGLMFNVMGYLHEILKKRTADVEMRTEVDDQVLGIKDPAVRELMRSTGMEAVRRSQARWRSRRSPSVPLEDEQPYQAKGYEVGLDPNSGEPLALQFGGITKAEYEYRNPHNNSHATRVLEGVGDPKE